MQGPAVSGARNYAELCIAAKNEEKCLADLKKRRDYSKLHIPATSSPRRQFDRPRQSSDTPDSHSPMSSMSSSSRPPGVAKTNLKCFYCGKLGHKKDDCRVMSKVATDCLTVYNEIQYYIGNIHGLMINCNMGGSIGHPRIIHDKDWCLLHVLVDTCILIQCIHGQPQIIHCTFVHTQQGPCCPMVG